jgi:hypothetical protein
MKIINRYRPDFGFAGEGTQMVGLALFIILLAFFIMLSGMTGFSVQRSEQIMDSVRDAFGVPSVIQIGGPGQNLKPSTNTRDGSGTSMQDVVGAFENEVPGVQATIIRRTGVLKMTVPVSGMNRMASLIPWIDERMALATLAKFIGEHPQRNYEVQLILTHNPMIDAVVRPLAAESFLPAWRQALVGAGLRDEQIISGVGPGPSGVVLILVEPRQSRGAP